MKHNGILLLVIGSVIVVSCLGNDNDRTTQPASCQHVSSAAAVTDKGDAIEQPLSSYRVLRTTGVDNVSDTTVQYDLYGFSSEGGCVKARYRNHKIVSAKIELFGETGKSVTGYLFKDQSISVTESLFTYNCYIYEDDFESNAPSNDIIDTFSVHKYCIDYNGNILWAENEYRELLNIYPQLKKRNIFTR